MSIGTLSGIITAILIVVFIGIVIWAWSGRRKQDFDEAARLPLEDEPADRHSKPKGSQS